MSSERNVESAVNDGPSSLEASQASTLSFPVRRLIGLAMVCLSLSLFKYARRDPLSGDVGFQAPLEIGLICGAFTFSFLTLFFQQRKMRMQLSSLCILLFGLLAFISSRASFWPMLSAVKALLFLMLIGTALLAGSAIQPRRALALFYWAMIGTIIFGLICGLLLPGQYPLFRSGVESGEWRTRLWIFDTHPGVIADYVALVFLIGCVVRPRFWPLSQGLLIGLNLLCAGRTSSALLMLCIGAILLFQLPRRVFRRIIIGSSILGLLLVIGLLVFGIPQFSAGLRAPGASDWLSRTIDELRSVNGRTYIWSYAIELLSATRGFGYGFEGTRVLFIEKIYWTVNAHSGYLDALLTGGIIGGALLIIGWLLVVHRIIHLPSRRDRVALLLLNMYLGLTSVIGGQLVVVPGLGVFLLTIIGLLNREQAGFSSVRSAQGDVSLQFEGSSSE